MPPLPRDRAAIAASIIADVEQLLGEGDELLVIRCVIDRLMLGRRSYGPLRVDDPRRSWPLERAYELADGDIYGLFELVRRQRARVAPAAPAEEPSKP